MRLSARQDIETPAAFAFAALSDFDSWERAAMRRGIEVQRTDKLKEMGAGMTWKIVFDFRGKKREFELRLINIIPNSKLEFAALSSAIDVTFSMEVIEMSTRRARLHSVTEITPLTLTAKLFIQSLRLARARVDRKYAQRLSQTVTEIEKRFRGEGV